MLDIYDSLKFVPSLPVPDTPVPKGVKGDKAEEDDSAKTIVFVLDKPGEGMDYLGEGEMGYSDSTVETGICSIDDSTRLLESMVYGL